MYLDSLDKSLTSLRHQTNKRKNVVRSKYLYIIIGLCVMFSFFVSVSFIIKIKIKSNNGPQNEEGKTDTQTNQTLGESISEQL